MHEEAQPKDRFILLPSSEIRHPESYAVYSRYKPRRMAAEHHGQQSQPHELFGIFARAHL